METIKNKISEVERKKKYLDSLRPLPKEALENLNEKIDCNI